MPGVEPTTTFFLEFPNKSNYFSEYSLLFLWGKKASKEIESNPFSPHVSVDIGDNALIIVGGVSGEEFFPFNPGGEWKRSKHYFSLQLKVEDYVVK